MKPSTLDSVLELRPAISLMLAVPDRMALLDERGRIAAINPAWREAARRSGGSLAASGRGACLLARCERELAAGDRGAGALLEALRRVMSREVPVATIEIARVGAGGGDECTGVVRRVRGALENWYLVAYTEASSRTASPASGSGTELGPLPGENATKEAAAEQLERVASRVALLDVEGRIFAVNAAWRESASENGASERAACEGADYLSVCERAAEGGDRRAARFASLLRSVICGRQRTATLDGRIESDGVARLFRGRATRIDGADGPYVVVSHTELGGPNVRHGRAPGSIAVAAGASLERRGRHDGAAAEAAA